jgi:hypothetical protein
MKLSQYLNYEEESKLVKGMRLLWFNSSQKLKKIGGSLDDSILIQIKFRLMN